MFEIHTAADHDRFVAVWLCVLAAILIAGALYILRVRVVRNRAQRDLDANDPHDFGDGGIP